VDFTLTEEQQALRKAARDFLEAKCPPELVQEMMEDELGYPTELWDEMARLGWQGLIMPQEYGGSGGGFLDLTVLLEEMGRVCLPGPFFSTVAVAVPFIVAAGDEKQKQALLPAVARGELTLTLALMEPQGGYGPLPMDTTVNSEGELNGTKLFVPDAHAADYIICAAGRGREETPGEEITLLLIDSGREGVRIEPLKTMGGERQCEVRFDSVRVSQEDILGEPHQGGRVLKEILDTAAVAKCAEMVGGAQRVLEMTVDYVKQREQSGRPIGGFQAIQHYCADMLRDVEGSRFITQKAAWEISENVSSPGSSAVAKAWVSDAYQRTVLKAHQIFGGIGFCQEHLLHHYLKQSKMGELAFGDAAYHRERVACSLGL
jgi:alkylation response protein AidB-like acyl-CoA dehydrogenase